MRVLTWVRDFLFPPLCVVCEEEVVDGDVCEGCWREIVREVLFEHQVFFGFRVYSLFHYGGRVKDVISGFKYRGFLQLAESFVPALAENLKTEGIDLIVPLPLHPARRRERGFSQTEVIARLLSKEMGLPVRRVLFRWRYTKPQALLKAERRKENVKGAFAHMERLKGERVLLVDDVITTGYTFFYAASELLRAGAGGVVGATLARGRV